MPDFDLEGRVAIVTGASRGLGSAIAQGLAEHGATVVLSSRRQADLDVEAERINALHPERAVAIAAHAGREPDLVALVDAVMARFGRIDILVNNAGTNPHLGATLDADPAQWDKTFEVNLRGYWLLSKLVVKAHMEAAGRGAIVNIASTGGLRPAIGLGVYDVTKAGVVMLTRQLAKELRGIRVNCIAPGLFKTRFAEALWTNESIMERIQNSSPLGRIGSPEEIAGAAVFLCSDAASYVNGAVLVVDGGSTEAG